MKEVFNFFTTKFRFLLLLMLLGFGQSLYSQSKEKPVTSKPLAKNRDISTEEAEKKVLDTDESIKYMSNRLMFQVKKRLHLLDEGEDAEEKKEREKAKDVKFSIFGITIEKD
ncbi:MAG: hypothetical protein RIC95_12630 [Vicingaceae bacterium]